MSLQPFLPREEKGDIHEGYAAAFSFLCSFCHAFHAFLLLPRKEQAGECLSFFLFIDDALFMHAH